MPAPRAEPASIPAMAAPPPTRDNPLTRSLAGILGVSVLMFILGTCVLTLPWTLSVQQEPAPGGTPGRGEVRFNAGTPDAGLLPPAWWGFTPTESEAQRLNRAVPANVAERIAAAHGVTFDQARESIDGPVGEAMRDRWPTFALGSDSLGRSLLIRCLTGGGISLGIGLAAALLSVVIGTLFGAISALAGGTVDAVMMRIVDILYGLPYILLVVLLAVAGDGVMQRATKWLGEQRAAYIELEAANAAVSRGLNPGSPEAQRLLDEDPVLRARITERALDRFPEISERGRMAFDVLVLLVAIGGVSWLTMARVVRGQVLSLKAQPFMEAARALGVPWRRQLLRHLLPNLLGPITVYATLTVPQAILQESFLSFLGIGVRPPLPSWGNLAADGLSAINAYTSHWWLLVFPCVLLGVTLLALNFVGEGLREALDPRRARR